MADKIFPKGVIGFQKHPNAPDFVLGSLIIDPNELTAWLRSDDGKSCLKEYEKKDSSKSKQLKLQILKAKTGNYLNFQVDTYEKPEQSQSAPQQESIKQVSNIDDSDLPF